MVRLHLPLPAPPPDEVTVEGERFHYLAHVLRVRAGDALELFDGAGTAFAARVEAVEERCARIRLLSSRSAAPGAIPLILIQGLPKGERWEWVLQKGTELGATEFAPALAARSVVKLPKDRAADKVRRWNRIVEEAARQCGANHVPQVRPVRPLVEAARDLPPGTALLVLDEEEREQTLAGAVARLGMPGRPLALAVGPEGGLERAEVKALAAAGGVPVTLGSRTLRTETAALAGLALLLHLRGELG